MKTLVLIATLTMVSIPNTEKAFGDTVGTKVITISNVTNSCINVQDHLVDFWILSARVPKKSNFWNSTNGVGARVDVQLIGSGGSGSHFPAAASIKTTDLNGKVIRASLSLHVLDQNELWNTETGSTTRTTSFNAPLSFVQRQGSSDTVKVMQALISFTNSASSVVPTEPFTKGAQLFGQFFNSLNAVFQPNPNEVFDPDFQLSFSLGRRDTGCQDIQLHDNIGAQISDADGAEADGIVKTQDIAKYCFYKLSNDRDPDIGFVTKSGATCVQDTPAGVKTLNNPQFIWMAFGTCKEEKTCAPSPPITSKNLMLLQHGTTVKPWLASRLPRDNQADSDRVDTAIQKGDLNSLNNISKSAGRLVQGLAMCASVGIAAERCFDHRFAVPQN